MAGLEQAQADVGIGHLRLSILDLTDAGRQPMRTRDGRVWITYNGEVYNYVELKQELEALGHVFRTRTDTEVILAAYRAWGTDCVKRFNGMWAFCIVDLERRILFCSRDRIWRQALPLLARRHAPGLRFRDQAAALLLRSCRAGPIARPCTSSWPTRRSTGARRRSSMASTSCCRGTA